MSDQFIGIDVGGTKIAVARRSRPASSPSRTLVEHTELDDQDKLVEQLVDAIEHARTRRRARGRDRRAVA